MLGLDHGLEEKLQRLEAVADKMQDSADRAYAAAELMVEASKIFSGLKTEDLEN